MSFGLSEPDAGSDAVAMTTNATEDGDEWVIGGSKIFITNAGLEHSRFVMVLARNPEGGFELVMVPKGAPGYTMGQPLRKMGLRSSDTRELFFDDCRVPAMNRLGAAGEGRRSVVGTGFMLTRLYLASQALGVAQECFDLALDHAKRRSAFGRSIARFQYVQAMLVDMALEIELGRLVRDRACGLHDAGQPYAKEAAMTKLFCTEMGKRTADQAIQIFGGVGFTWEYDVHLYFKRARAGEALLGTPAFHRERIAKHLAL